MKILEITPDAWEMNPIKCGEMFKDKSTWDSVPLYNSSSEPHVKEGQLVRFIGMIQDMLDPEIYFRSYEVRDKRTGELSLKSGMYRDFYEHEEHAILVENSVHNERDDRVTFYCVTIPGINGWITKIQEDQSSELINPLVSPDSNGSVRPGSGIKRSFDQMEGMPEKMESDDLVSAVDPEGSIQHATEEGNVTSPSDASLQPKGGDLNHPLKDPNAKACYLKIYDWNSDKYKLNDMVDVIAFVSLDPYLATLDADDGMDASQPAMWAPRLHVVMMDKIDHVNPLVGPSDKEAVLAEAGDTFAELLHLLTQVSMGDPVCAEYFIYSIVASVYYRSNGDAQGQLPLNIFNAPANPMFVDEVYSIVKNLTEKSHSIKMDIAQLNTKVMIPCKSYERNLLQSGELQLTNNTVLFVDETQLEEGQLVNTGCLNFAALKSVCEKQILGYNFTHYTLEYETNLNILIFSRGRSLLPCSVSLKMNPCPESVTNMAAIFEATKFFGFKETVVTKFRKYLTVVRDAKFSITDEMQKTLEESFVRFRKEDRTFVPTNFHTMLVIARIASICRGEPTLTAATWNTVQELEHKRKERFGN